MTQQNTQTFAHNHELSMPVLVIPSPAALQSQQQTQSCSLSRPASKPKLSLNINPTTQARTFGKGSSLRLETLSAVSPTVVNTFTNAYNSPKTPATATAKAETQEPQQAPTPTLQRPSRPKLSINSAVYVAPKISCASPESQGSRTPSSCSVSSASTTNSATIPYQISHTLNSILANSPILRTDTRKMSSRPRFPAEKKVSFRTPLVEEIRTSKYTLAHSDIESAASSLSLSTESVSSEQTTSEAPSSSAESTSSSDASDPSASTSSSQFLRTESSSELRSTSISDSSSVSSTRALRLPHRLSRSRIREQQPQTGDKRDSSDESDSDTCPETPVAGRRKRQREWIWTLGPLPGSSLEDSHTTSADESTSPSTDFTSSTASNKSDESS